MPPCYHRFTTSPKRWKAAANRFRDLDYWESGSLNLSIFRHITGIPHLLLALVYTVLGHHIILFGFGYWSHQRSGGLIFQQATGSVVGCPFGRYPHGSAFGSFALVFFSRVDRTRLEYSVLSLVCHYMFQSHCQNGFGEGLGIGGRGMASICCVLGCGRYL